MNACPSQHSAGIVCDLSTHDGGAAKAPASLPRRVRFHCFNRRKTNGIGRIAARAIEQLVDRPTLTMKMLIRETLPRGIFPN
jgi:hypothetical protein